MTCCTPAMHKLTVADCESIILNLFDMRGDASRRRIIAGEAGSPGRCVFSLLWFYLHGERIYVQPYSLSAAFSKPLLLSLRNEKWLKYTPDKSDSPLLLLWTLHRFLYVSREMTHSIIQYFQPPHFSHFLSWLFSHTANSCNATHFKLHCTIMPHQIWVKTFIWAFFCLK